ncbi:MAG: hypothetical protein HQK89_05745 [Nitrospirae bacterium]|nr:hypothetical protein [Nitrospirota bacterium]
MEEDSVRKVIYLVLVFFNIVVLANFVYADETYQSVNMWPVPDQPWYFNGPSGIAVDSSGNVYVADTSNNRIQKFNSSGQFIAKWGSQGNGDGQFYQPFGIAVDSSGNVYVADTSNNRIQKFNSSGQFVAKWGSSGTGDGQFYLPEGIAVDSSGNVYVADTYNERIQKFSSSGQFIAKWGSQGNGDGQFYQPFGIAVDSSGNVYVADYINNRIQKFGSSGLFIAKWGSTGTDDGQFEYPKGIAIDSSGNVYVVDSGNNRIQKFSSSGLFIAKWGSTGTDDGQFYWSTGIAVDNSGNVYVAEHNRVQKFSSSGLFIAKWGSFGSGDGQFYQPFGIAVDSSGNVYVADYINNRIQKFSSSGLFIAKWGSGGAGDGQFEYPKGIAVDSSGNVYVVDSGNNRVQKFSSSGLFIAKWGSFGSGDGQFDQLEGIAVDSSGNVYVADDGDYRIQNRIQKFSSTGQFIAKWGSFGSGDGQFDQLEGIAVDSSGNVYVADDGDYRIQNRIQKFSSTGQFIAKWGSFGSGDGQFDQLEGIAVDSSGNVYVADIYYEYDAIVKGLLTPQPRIQKFSSSGQFIAKWGSQGSSDGQFDGPIGIAADSSGNVYVADGGIARIQKFSSSGQFITKWGSFGSDQGQFNYPVGIALNSNGDVYVSDTANNRIQVFSKNAPIPVDKAIIVAGSGPNVNQSIWAETTLNTERADFALKMQGFSKSTIYYMSYSFGEFDPDGVDNIKALITNTNLRQATMWAAGSRNVIVYLIGHGDVGKFLMNDAEVLAASDLSSWLDTLQSTITGTMVVIYESCYSGSFLSQLKPSAGTPAGKRILITSSKSDEQAYFADGGRTSFSNYFWSDVLYGENIYDSFVDGKGGVPANNLQDPQIDANGNGIPNEKDDIAIAQAFTIGNGIKNLGAIPAIKGNVTAVLTGKTTGTINVSNIVTTGTIQEVDALIIPPSIQSDSAGNPITSAYVPKVVLNDMGGGNYQGTYDKFTENGVYYISVYAIDTRTKMSLPVTTTLTQSSGTSSDPVPAIKANGQTGSITIKSTDKLSITVSLDPGGQSGTKADWWLYANTDFGNFYYDAATGAFAWKAGKSVTYQGALFNLPSTEMLNYAGFPVGSYTFNFKVDLTPNGVLDGQIYSGSVTVNVNQ